VHQGGTKGFRVLRALVCCELLGKTTGRGVGLSHYECLDADTPSRFYVDVDYAARERNDKNFKKRFEHCKLVLHGVLERVLLVASKAIAVQVSTASSRRAQEWRLQISAHVCLQGFYMRDASVRGELKKALLFFLENPPKSCVGAASFVSFKSSRKESPSTSASSTQPYTAPSKLAYPVFRVEGVGPPSRVSIRELLQQRRPSYWHIRPVRQVEGHRTRRQPTGGFQSGGGAPSKHFLAPRGRPNTEDQGDFCPRGVGRCVL
jgi:hypothetical protein